MQQKLQELTETIYQEGVRKGETRAQEIIDAAQESAKKVAADAQTQAQKIIADAQERALELKGNTESEIRLAGQQALAALRQQIEQTIYLQMVDKPIAAVLDNPEVVRDLLAAVVAGWAQQGSAVSLEAILPAAQQEALDKALKGALNKTLGNGLTVSYSRALKSGFQIQQQGSGYKIGLTDQDFAEFVKDFLRPRTKAYLFGE